LPFAAPGFALPLPLVEGCCDTTGPDGNAGAVEVVDDVVPFEVGCDDVVDGGALGEHDSLIAAICKPAGSDNDDNGVPAGTVNDNTLPPSTVTDTTQESAEADGNAARPPTPSNEADPAAATKSFRELNKWSLSPPGGPPEQSRRCRDHEAAPVGRYLLTPWFATTNCA
jgi:hypothetical protein